MSKKDKDLESISITISKVNYNGKFSHWESNLSSNNNAIFCEATGPRFTSVLDVAIEHLYETEGRWLEDDANDII